MATIVAAEPAGADVGMASVDDTVASRRAAIVAERAAIEDRYTARQQQCAKQFVVTSCVNEARQQRRTALVPLRQEELRLDLAERSERAATRLEEIEAKQKADAAERDAASGRPTTAASGTASGLAAPRRAPPATPRLLPPPVHGVDAAERQRREAASVARFEAQQTEVSKHRADVETRNALRAAQGKVARPLPVASGASSAR